MKLLNNLLGIGLALGTHQIETAHGYYHRPSTSKLTCSKDLHHHVNLGETTVPSTLPNARLLEEKEQVSDIQLDPAITLGELDNGMRYMLMQNDIPENQVQIKLHIGVGAKYNPDDQLGLARFLMFMGFRSLAHFPEGDELLPIFQRLGINLFRHVNANINFERTVYWLSLPNSNETTLDTAMTWFRDCADGMLLLEDELEIERQIVTSELQDRDSVEERIWKRVVEWMVPDHKMATHFAGGTVESVATLEHDQFVEFYNKYYTPERATLVIVGDMNVTDMQALVHDYFDSWGTNSTTTSQEDPEELELGQDPEAPEPEAKKEVDLGTIPTGQGLQTAVFIDDELQEYELVLETVRSIEDEPKVDTIEGRIKDIHMFIANDIVKRRIRKLSGQQNSTIYWAGATSKKRYGALQFTSVHVNPDPLDWTKSVATLEQEWRRARLYGFDQVEIDQTTAELLDNLEQRILAKETRKSRSLANSLVDSISDHRIVSTPEENLLIASVAVESATPENLHRLYDTYWNTSDLFLYLTTEDTSLSESRATMTLETLFLQSQLVDLLPPPTQENVTFAYTNEYFASQPDAMEGEVIYHSIVAHGGFGSSSTNNNNDTAVEDYDSDTDSLQYKQILLSNNIVVNLKQTDLEAGRIRVNARFGSGRLGQPADTPYLDAFTEYMIDWGGLGHHDWSEIDQVMAGKQVGLNFEVESSSFVFEGNTNADDLLVQLQYMAAHFLDPGFGDESYFWFQEEIPGWRNSMDFTLDGVYYHDLFGWLLGGDRRYAEPTEAELYALKISDAMDWLVPQLQESYLEITIVGDLINETTTINHILQTFGTLPERAKEKEVFSELDRAVAIPQPPQEETFYYKSKVPVAGTMLVWEIASLYEQNVTLTRHIDVVTEILSNRMFDYVRLELGGSYAPYAYTTRSRGMQYGFLFAYVDGTPDEIETLANATIAVAQNMSLSDISDDEIDRTILGQISKAEESLASNRFWLKLMEHEYPVQVDELKAINPDEIRNLASELLQVDKAIRLTILPITYEGEPFPSNVTTSVGK